MKTLITCLLLTTSVAAHSQIFKQDTNMTRPTNPVTDFPLLITHDSAKHKAAPKVKFLNKNKHKVLIGEAGVIESTRPVKRKGKLKPRKS